MSRAAVASSVGPQQVGGLTAAVTRLTQALSATEWTWLVRRDDAEASAADSADWGRAADSPVDGALLRVVEPEPVLRPALGAVSRARFVPGGGAVARWGTQAAWARPVVRALPASPTVVHWVGTGWELFGFALLAAARRVGAPFTVCPFLHAGSWGDSELDATLYRRADACFAQTVVERDALVRLGVEQQRVHVVGLGPSSESTGDAQAFRRRHGLGDRPVVLFVGRRTPAKGLGALEAAMAALGGDAVLVIVGPGGPPPSRSGATLDLGLCDDAEKSSAYAAADVVCLPSATESFGLVVVEAWAHAKPVVVGPAPALRELVEDGVDGLVVRQDPAAIAAGLERLLDDEDKRRAMGAAGRRKQQDRYTWPRVATQYADVFRAL